LHNCAATAKRQTNHAVMTNVCKRDSNKVQVALPVAPHQQQEEPMSKAASWPKHKPDKLKAKLHKHKRLNQNPRHKQQQVAVVKPMFAVCLTAILDALIALTNVHCGITQHYRVK